MPSPQSRSKTGPHADRFHWNDGGRAAAGYVGLTGDCVTRALAIATGTSYREIYDKLGETCNKTPRNGVPTKVMEQHLQDENWTIHRNANGVLLRDLVTVTKAFETGITIVHVDRDQWRGSSHVCTFVDGVLHDTWDVFADEDLHVICYWTHPERTSSDVPGPWRRKQAKEQLEQSQASGDSTAVSFERILQRIRALDNTANNHASTEGEKRNAIRMMQTLLLKHNLDRDDIRGDDDAGPMVLTRRACPVNGSRAYIWEGNLAHYVCQEVFPLVQYYSARCGHRTLFYFYGPRQDVDQSIDLFTELLVTIAAAARLRYGGYSRGSGASYAEGYVAGLPRSSEQADSADQDSPSESVVSGKALIHARTLAVHRKATDWLRDECGVRLQSTSGRGRSQHDPVAAGAGRRDGRKQSVGKPDQPKRISGPK